MGGCWWAMGRVGRGEGNDDDDGGNTKKIFSLVCSLMQLGFVLTITNILIDFYNLIS